MPKDADEFLQLLRDEQTAIKLQKAVFSVPRAADSSILKVSVRPVSIRGERMLQFTSQSATQQFHQNLSCVEAGSEFSRLATESFRNIHLNTIDLEAEARFSRKDKCLFRKKQIAAVLTDSQLPSHNQTRNHLIAEGVPCPFLIHTGVMSADGSVRASHSRKFRQINRFLEFIYDVVELLPTDRPIQIVDFGCGKSYLTFATHYLLTEVLKRECNIVGLDRRADVVDTCTQITKQLGLTNLSFEVGDIAGYDSTNAIDMVISLHACDTATDDALLQAIRWKSSVILAVPCCQHELNSHLSTTALPPLTSFGITKERFASMLTDTMRAGLLNAIGYQTQMLEFIETEHTPKNLLIRSLRKVEARTNEERIKQIEEIQAMRTQLGIPALAFERGLAQLDSH